MSAGDWPAFPRICDEEIELGNAFLVFPSALYSPRAMSDKTSEEQ